MRGPRSDGQTSPLSNKQGEAHNNAIMADEDEEAPPPCTWKKEREKKFNEDGEEEEPDEDEELPDAERDENGVPIGKVRSVDYLPNATTGEARGRAFEVSLVYIKFHDISLCA